MRSKTSVALAFLTTVAMACSISHAQCNRGSRSGPPRGQTSYSTNNMAYRPPPPNIMAQQQYQRRLLAQQRYQQNEELEEPATPTFGSEELMRDYAANSSRRKSTAGDREERIRQKNAKRAYAYAVRSESAGKVATAGRQYRRVIDMLGESNELGQLASAALSNLPDRVRPEHEGNQTMLVSLTKVGS